jgi:hypothetical protein
MDSLFLKNFDLQGYINEYVVHKVFDVALIGLNNAIKRINKPKNIIKLQKFNIDDFQVYISKHIEENLRWATNISFRDATKSKTLTDIFVDLDLFITPRKLRIDSKENIPTIPINELLTDTEKNLILLGQPGAGKTTSVKKLFLEVLLRSHDIYRTFSFPIVIRLKELSFEKNDNGLILFKEILNTLGISYFFEGQVDEMVKEKILIHIFKDFIERLDILIILDGYDEISDDKAKTEIISNLRLMTNSLVNSKFILTSRSADYDLHIDNTSEYEICPLNHHQIEVFISKWIGDMEQSKNLYKQLAATPYWDTTIRPLTLAHLCALYERNNAIPEKPKSVYKKIIQLLLEDWSSQASVKRKSKYGKFEVDRKMDFLSRFAFELTVAYNRSSFDKIILEQIYNEICVEYGLPKGESSIVVNEIESHNGLILQTGSNIYEFAHKSLLEYLVADYLVKLPSILSDESLLLKLPNELAILIAISSNPNATYYELIVNSLKHGSVNRSFLKTFLSRLMIEKPDFDPGPLYALTHIFLLNAIAIRIYNIKHFLSAKNGTKPKFIQEGSKDCSFHNMDGLEDEFDDDDDDELYRNIDEEPDYDFRKNDLGDDEEDGREKDDDEYEDIDNTEYLIESSEMIWSFHSDSIFKKSISEVKKDFIVGEITLRSDNPSKELSRWGQIRHLKPKKEYFHQQSRKIKYPNYLLTVAEFMRVQK